MYEDNVYCNYFLRAFKRSRPNSTKGIASGRRKGLPKLRSSQDNNQLLLSGAGFSSGKVAAVHSSGCWPEAGPLLCLWGQSTPAQNTDWQRNLRLDGFLPCRKSTKFPPVTATPKDKGEGGSSRDGPLHAPTACRGTAGKVAGIQGLKSETLDTLRSRTSVPNLPPRAGARA